MDKNYYNSLLEFSQENNLSLFEDKKLIFPKQSSSFVTRDAKSIKQKIINLLSKFHFKETKFLWQVFSDFSSNELILDKQSFFKSLPTDNSFSFLNELKAPFGFWKPKYSLIVVTEDENIFTQLKERKIPVSFIVNSWDIQSLKDYDVVQVIDCDNFKLTLEDMPNTVFLNSIDDAYPERFLTLLSGWKEIIEIINNNVDSCSSLAFYDDFKSLIFELKESLHLCSNEESVLLDHDSIEAECDECNLSLSAGLKNLTLSGDVLFNIMSQRKLPPEVDDLIKTIINESKLPFDFFISGIPLKLDYDSIQEHLNKQNADSFSNLALP